MCVCLAQLETVGLGLGVDTPLSQDLGILVVGCLWRGGELSLGSHLWVLWFDLSPDPHMQAFTSEVPD